MNQTTNSLKVGIFREPFHFIYYPLEPNSPGLGYDVIISVTRGASNQWISNIKQCQVFSSLEIDCTYFLPDEVKANNFSEEELLQIFQTGEYRNILDNATEIACPYPQMVDGAGLVYNIPDNWIIAKAVMTFCFGYGNRWTPDRLGFSPLLIKPSHTRGWVSQLQKDYASAFKINIVQRTPSVTSIVVP